MRRDRIVEAVDNLRDALQACQIRDLLRAARSGQTAEGVNRTQTILHAYSVFSRHYQNFSEEEKDIMAMFGLSPLLDVNFWSSLIDADQAISRKVLTDVDVGAYNVIHVMPKLRDLLTRENDRDELVFTDASGVEHDMRRLRLLVAERGRSLTLPNLITGIIKAMDDLYEGLAMLRGETKVGLAIGAIDSGSSKSFDFFGAAGIMEEIRALLLNVWDRIKYSTEDNFRYQIEVAIMATGFISRIKDAQAAGLITEEQGQRITRAVAKSIETLFRSGAYTDEMDTPREVKASVYLTPKTPMIEFRHDDGKHIAKRDDFRERQEAAGEAVRAANAPPRDQRDHRRLPRDASDDPFTAPGPGE